jgi:hypothetical protein
LEEKQPKADDILNIANFFRDKSLAWLNQKNHSSILLKAAGDPEQFRLCLNCIWKLNTELPKCASLRDYQGMITTINYDLIWCQLTPFKKILQETLDLIVETLKLQSEVNEDSYDTESDSQPSPVK